MCLEQWTQHGKLRVDVARAEARHNLRAQRSAAILRAICRRRKRQWCEPRNRGEIGKLRREREDDGWRLRTERPHFLPRRQSGGNHYIGIVGDRDIAAHPDVGTRGAQHVECVADTGGAASGLYDGVTGRRDRAEWLAVGIEWQIPYDLGATRMALEKIGQGGGIPAQHYAARVGGFREQGIELAGEALRPGEDDGLDDIELQCGARDERGKIGGRTNEETDAPFL